MYTGRYRCGVQCLTKHKGAPVASGDICPLLGNNRTGLSFR